MGSVKAAVFCHAPWEPEGREMERELSRQLELLEEGCKKRGIEVVARYFHVGQTGLHPKGSVMLDMLRAAKRGDFEWIVVENFGKFPRCPQQDIPPLCLYSMREGRQKRVGRSRSRLFFGAPGLP